MIAYDDMDSLSKEEMLGVLSFDGGQVGTKQDGLQIMVIFFVWFDLNKIRK